MDEILCTYLYDENGNRNVSYSHVNSVFVDNRQQTLQTYMSKTAVNPNLLINPAFEVNLKRLPKYTQNYKFSIDRWILINSDVESEPSGILTDYNDLVTNSHHALLSNFGTVQLYLLQRLFEHTTNSMIGKTVTVSARMKIENGKSGTAFLQLGNYDGVSTNWNHIHTELIPYDTQDWTVVSFSYTISEDNVNSFFQVAVGSYDFDGHGTEDVDGVKPAGTILNTDAKLYIDWVKLEFGNIATEHLPRPYSVEKLMCQQFTASGFSLGDSYENEIPLTWQEIKDCLDLGGQDAFKIGDYKYAKVGNVDCKFTVVGINNYSADDTGIVDAETGEIGTYHSRHMDFVIDLCSPVGSNTVANSASGTPTPYYKSSLFTTLNNIYENSLPEDLKAVIAGKAVMLENKATNDSTGCIWKFLKLWPLHEIELYGYQCNSQIGFGTGNFVQYPLFREHQKYIRKKDLSGASYSKYWLINPRSGNSTEWCLINVAGNIGATPCNSTDVGLVFGFRISSGV